MIRFFRFIFSIISKLSPQLAGRLTLLLFSYPFKTGRLSAAEKRLAARADMRLKQAQHTMLTVNGKAVALWEFAPMANHQRSCGDAKTILLVHGWMSGARYMVALADALCQEGHRVICLDLPAHGRSQGRITNLAGCADAVRAVIAHDGAVDVIIAHSFGGAVTAWALNGDDRAMLSKAGEVILLAAPNQLASVTAGFSGALGLSPTGQKVFETRLCAPFGRALAAMTGNALFTQAGYPVTAIHSRDDAEVGIEEARKLCTAPPFATLVELDGLGHRRVLYQKDALAAIKAAVAAPPVRETA